MLNQGLGWLAEGYRPSDHLLIEHGSIPESEDKIHLTVEDAQRLYPENETPPAHPVYPRRAQSARARICYRVEESPGTKPPVPKRPSSAQVPNTGKGMPKRRLSSAGSSRSVMGTPRQGIPGLGFNYFIPTDPRSKLRMGFTPDPTQMYMDRHSRCFDHSHIHDPLISYRPQPACRSAWVPTGSRPGSACSARAGYQGNMSKIQRYADHHRPQTAPGTRKELQVLTKSNFVIRGLKPHFCNFVRGMNLHERDVTDRSRGCNGERNGEGEYETDGHTTESISLGQWRRGSSASGIEGRPGSPSSIGDDEKSATDSWSRDRFGSKRKGKGAISETDEENSAREDKENDLQTYVQIPPPLPPSQPQSAWKEQSKVKKKSGPSKKGGKSGGAGTTKDTGGGGNGDEGKGKKRSCVKKKEKKGMNRQRESTQDMEPQPEPVISIIEEKKTPEPEKDGEGFRAEVKIPDLPTSTKPNKDAEERAARARRNQIEADFLRSDLNDVLNQEMRDHHKEFDFELDNMSEDTLSKLSSSMSGFSDDYLGTSYDSNSVRMSSWLTGRLALSQQSSRFTLPMDMKVLEKMSPEQYLRNYCVISSRRHILYQKIFSKNRDKTGIIPFKDVEKALKDVLVNTIQHEEVEEICTLLELTEETRLDYQLFCGLSAFAERILYPKFVLDKDLTVPKKRL